MTELCVLWRQINKHSAEIHTLLCHPTSPMPPSLPPVSLDVDSTGNSISGPLTPLVQCSLNTFPGENARPTTANSVSWYLHLCYLQSCEISMFSICVFTLLRAKRITVLRND